jgi:hypothetical protein
MHSVLLSLAGCRGQLAGQRCAGAFLAVRDRNSAAPAWEERSPALHRSAVADLGLEGAASAGMKYNTNAAAVADSLHDLSAVGLRSCRLVVSYDGTDYHGWQLQTGGKPTVQLALETALGTILQEGVFLLGVGVVCWGCDLANAGARCITQLTIHRGDSFIPALYFPASPRSAVQYHRLTPRSWFTRERELPAWL